uniref:U41-Liphistoxin-Lth1a_1 n=1 Tax=Liphistius thaleban TaxID=1905330 RepID=A0A4Q8K178_9ARAC
MAKFILLVVILGISVPMQILAYAYNIEMDTTSGFCKVTEVLKIPVRKVGYYDKACERFKCFEGMLAGVGCGPIPRHTMGNRCRLFRGEGHYPDCCLQLKCD